MSLHSSHKNGIPLGHFSRNSKRNLLQIIGSNNFVVSGAHTASSKPLLANDTHLQLGIPALWYVIHLTAPGWNVSGFALPGAPLVVIGHNDRIAWGFTNSNADVQDLYAETFDSCAPSLTTAPTENGSTASLRPEIIHVRGKRESHSQVSHAARPNRLSRPPTTPSAAGMRCVGPRSNLTAWISAFPFSAKRRIGTNFWRRRNALLVRDKIRFTRTLMATSVSPFPRTSRFAQTAMALCPFLAIPMNTNGPVTFHSKTLPRALNPPDGIIATANAFTVGPNYKYLFDRSASWPLSHRTNLRITHGPRRFASGRLQCHPERHSQSAKPLSRRPTSCRSEQITVKGFARAKINCQAERLGRAGDSRIGRNFIHRIHATRTVP